MQQSQQQQQSDDQLKLPVVKGRRSVTRGGMRTIWRNGQPVPIYTPPVTPDNIQDMHQNALQQTYKPPLDAQGNLLDPKEEEFIGMPKLEVGFHKRADKIAAGDEDALERSLDRLIGKPKQSVESVSVSMSLQDFVAGLRPPTIDELEDAGLTPEDVKDIIDITATTNTTDEDEDEDEDEDLLEGL